MVSPRHLIDVTPNLLSEFWKRVYKTERCWLWIGCIIKDGYGHLTIDGKILLAHRVSYAIHKTEPGALQVLHTCDVRCCVNPEHLVLGTQTDNMKDMHIKSRHPGKKLTAADVKQIRGLLLFNSRREVARMFDVAPPTIDAIANGVTWTHVS